MLKEDYAAALARSQEAEALIANGARRPGLASELHQQGLIFTGQARAAATDDEAARHRGAAFDRFKASLAISGASGTRPAWPTRWASWASWEGCRADAGGD